MSCSVMDCGFSEQAGKVAEYRRWIDERAECTVTGSREDSYAELDRATQACSKPDWDGHGARPIDGLSLEWAVHVLRSLPRGAVPPGIGVDPDGEVSLEWYSSSHRTLAISVSPSGDLRYAGIVDGCRFSGSIPFFGQFPRELTSLLDQVYA